MRISWLGGVEALALCVWLALASHLVMNNGDDRVVLSIDPDALVLGPSQERWMGIFFEDQHVGFSVARSATIDGGGTLYEGRSQFRVATFGKIQQVTTAGTALVDSSGALTRLKNAYRPPRNWVCTWRWKITGAWRAPQKACCGSPRPLTVTLGWEC